MQSIVPLGTLGNLWLGANLWFLIQDVSYFWHPGSKFTMGLDPGSAGRRSVRTRWVFLAEVGGITVHTYSV